MSALQVTHMLILMEIIVAKQIKKSHMEPHNRKLILELVMALTLTLIALVVNTMNSSNVLTQLDALQFQ